MTYAEFRSRRPDWAMAMGAASALSIPPQGVGAILPRVIDGLKMLQVRPGMAGSDDRGALPAPLVEEAQRRPMPGRWPRLAKRGAPRRRALSAVLLAVAALCAAVLATHIVHINTPIVPVQVGYITYRLIGGHVYRIAAQAGARPQDISEALNRLARGRTDDFLNISPNGAWLVLTTDRFDPGCVDWSCLALVKGDLSAGGVIRVNTTGELIHPNEFSAVASSGKLIVYPAEGGPHRLDLWAVTGSGNTWNQPLLLTRQSPYAYNDEPSISTDGRSVVFACGAESYDAPGTALCAVGTDGRGFRTVLTPADSPAGLPHAGTLSMPSYAPDGSVYFSADWTGDQVWRLPAGTVKPARVSFQFKNDSSPCVLPNGRIASLWLDRPGGPGLNEIKVMDPDGNRYIMVVTGKDVADVGLGCGG
jgi:hypothetical protein